MAIRPSRWRFAQGVLHKEISISPPPGYLGSSPDPGCEFPASTSPKNTGESSKIILFNEYDEYKWASLMPKHDNFLLNKNMNFPYSLSFDPVSSPSNHLLKIIFFTSFFISDSTVLRKMDHFDISFVIWKLSRSRELTKPTLLDPDHFPGSLLWGYGLFGDSILIDSTQLCLDCDLFFSRTYSFSLLGCLGLSLLLKVPSCYLFPTPTRGNANGISEFIKQKETIFSRPPHGVMLMA